MSLIAWLDVSADEQRRVRELVQMFSDPSTLDELGIGQIRDAFSDTLFPGTSTVQTRARYFMFVPWAYRLAAERGRASAISTKAESYERITVETLRQAEVGLGVIGGRAGKGVKILPSAIYWGGLTTFGILTQAVARDQIRGASIHNPDSDELAQRAVGDWSPTMPRWPDGFPQQIPGGFAMTSGESAWLRERVLTAVPDTFLADLLRSRAKPTVGSLAPWLDPAAAVASERNRVVLRDAELFSTCMYGSSLLYNLLVREHYTERGLTRVDTPIEDYRDLLTKWADQIAGIEPAIAAWDRSAMWQMAVQRSPRLSFVTRTFVESWITAIARGAAAGAADNEDLRRMVAAREWQMKGTQSRLHNDRILANWLGAAGMQSLNYRWPNVRTIVTDIEGGLDRAGS